MQPLPARPVPDLLPAVAAPWTFCTPARPTSPAPINASWLDYLGVASEPGAESADLWVRFLHR